MRLTLKIWRQESGGSKGRFEIHELQDASPDMSFLEMLDVLNERLIERGEEPVAFEHDCREGICGACSMVVDGHVHGVDKAITTCQLHMRSFKDGDSIYIEPFRAKGFPVLKDLIVDRSAFDRIIEAGGYVSVGTGGTPDADIDADEAWDLIAGHPSIVVAVLRSTVVAPSS